MTDKKLDERILKAVNDNQKNWNFSETTLALTTSDIRKELGKSQGCIVEHVQKLVNEGKLVRANQNGVERVTVTDPRDKDKTIIQHRPVFGNALRGGVLLTPEYYADFTRGAVYAEEVIKRDRKRREAEFEQLKKKIISLEGLKVPVDCKELVDRVFRLEDENEKLRELVQIQARKIENSKKTIAFQVENVELVDSLKKEIESLKKEENSK
jgi:biotin operon repressor